MIFTFWTLQIKMDWGFGILEGVMGERKKIEILAWIDDLWCVKGGNG